MKKIEIYTGTIYDAMQRLYNEEKTANETCYCEFNGKQLYYTDTMDEAYMKIVGMTKAEFDKKEEEWHKNYERELAEHKAKIPQLTEEYRKKARGLVLDGTLDFWDKIVPIRLDDLYRGMELQNTLDICSIMRDDSLTYDERLRKAYKCFMDEGHSGMSASLTASMIKKFCPDGADVADAVMNFRFD